MNVSTSPPPELPIPKKMTQLIVLQPNTLQYYAGCKVAINSVERKLIVTPHNNNVQPIKAAFQRQFLYQKNIFCVVPSGDDPGIVLVFPREETCQTVFEGIQQRRNPSELSTRGNDVELLQQNAFAPMVKEVNKNGVNKTHLVDIVVNFLEALIGEDRMPYLEVLKHLNSEILLHERVVPLTAEFNNNDVKPGDPPIINLRMDDSTHGYGNETMSASGTSTLNPNTSAPAMAFSSSDLSSNFYNHSTAFTRPLKRKTIGSSNEIAEQSRPVKRQILEEHQIIKPPMYEIKEVLDKGSQKKRLVIFTSAERNMCYIYNFHPSQNCFSCLNCNRRGKHVSAKLLLDDEESVRLGFIPHVCDPVEYNPEDFKDVVLKIVHSPNFEEIMVNYRGKLYPRVYVFASENLCYQYCRNLRNKYYFCGDCYNRHNIYVYAKVVENENGEKHAELFGNEHLCQGRSYRRDESNKLYVCLPPSLREGRIDRSPEENLVPSSTDGLLVNQIPKNPVPASHHTSSSNNNSIVPVSQIPDEVEEAIDPYEAIEDERQIIQPPMYEIKEFVDKGSQKKRLVIFTSAERNMCYIYNYQPSANDFLCRNCGRKGKRIRAKLLLDEEESVRLGSIPHVCVPVEYNPEDFKNIVRRTVHSPNFEVIMVKYGGKIYPRVYVFASENLCYQFSHHQGSYYCADCHDRYRVYVYAKVIENANGEKHLDMCDKDHRCEGRSYRRDENNELYVCLPRSLREVRIDRCPEENPVPSSTDGLFVNQIPKNPVPASKLASSSKNNSIVSVPQIPAEVEEADEDEPGIVMEVLNSTVNSARFKIETYIGYVGVETKRLIVFYNANPNLAYIYHPVEADNKTFVCNGCSTLSAGRRRVWAKLSRNDNDAEVLQLGPSEHVCKPKPYPPVEPISKVVKEPDYRLEYFTKDGVEMKFMTIFSDDILCYDYEYIPSRNLFACSQCKKMGRKITAQLQTDDQGEEFVSLSKMDHICQPLPKKRELDSAEYELTINDSDAVSKISVFASDDKSLCYVFSPFRDNRYRCQGCGNQTCEVKLFEDEIGNYYVRMGNVEHVCQPIPREL